MKLKTLLKSLVFIFLLNACSNLPTGPASPPCDDTENPLTVTLDWQNVPYLSGFSLVANTPAPLGPFNTYQQQDSQTTPANNSFQYYCKVIILSGCSKSSGSTYSKSYLWASPNLDPSNHLVLNGKGLKNEPTQITVEYYCPCLLFTTSSTTVSRHPYYLGVTTIPAGATAISIKMTVQPVKEC